MQRVLATIQEAARDASFDFSYPLRALHTTKGSAVSAWGTEAPLSPRLMALHLADCSGQGHTWVTDSDVVRATKRTNGVLTSLGRTSELLPEPNAGKKRAAPKARVLKRPR